MGGVRPSAPPFLSDSQVRPLLLLLFLLLPPRSYLLHAAALQTQTLPLYIPLACRREGIGEVPHNLFPASDEFPA